jgi:hypothetical protein
MTGDLFNAEHEAQRSLLDLYEQAKKCQQLFERANVALPEVLKRVLGMSGASQKANISHVAAPERPPMPPEAEQHWISIRDKEALPTSVVLAILRKAKGPLRAKDLNARVIEVLPNVLRGSISNIGTRLKDKAIRLTGEGWEAIAPENAGVLHKGFFWGPPAIFAKQELASHRRDAILHILGHFQTGLQTVQIVDELRKCEWVRAPINKDLVKEDMEILAKLGKVRRGSSKKWSVIPVSERETL